MRNEQAWQPSKFERVGDKLRGSRNQAELSVGSRLAADAVASLYARFIPEHVRGRLVDLGCGKAPLFGTYRPHAQEVFCADWPNSLHPSPHIDCACDLTAPLPFLSGTFDTIILSDVLEHIPNPWELWAEMSRVLRPGGKILLNVPFYYQVHEAPHDFYRYTQYALQRFAGDTAMRVCELIPIGGSPEIFGDLCAKHLMRVPVVGSAAAMMVQALVALVLRSSIGQRLSRRSAAWFPFGYFVIAEKARPQ